MQRKPVSFCIYTLYCTVLKKDNFNNHTSTVGAAYLVIDPYHRRYVNASDVAKIETRLMVEKNLRRQTDAHTARLPLYAVNSECGAASIHRTLGTRASRPDRLLGL